MKKNVFAYDVRRLKKMYEDQRKWRKDGKMSTDQRKWAGWNNAYRSQEVIAN